jgi:hypothetical protein
MKEEKTQLQEGTIRRFMKLAGTQPLASDFVNENYPPVYKDDEELEAPDELELDLDAPDDLEAPPEPELEPEDIAGEGEVTLTDEDVDTLLAALDAANALADKLRGAADMAAPEELEAAELELPPEDGMTGEPLEVEEEEEIGLDEAQEEELEEAQEDLEEDKPYTAKKEKAGRDKRKGAEKRGAEGTLAKTKGHGRVDYANEAVVNEVYKRVAQRLSELKGE